MASTDAFALQHSELNGFLFAEVGVEPGGMRLTVLSALARLGTDPWQEAGRLAALPRTAAAETLAQMIAAMPASLWTLADATAIASRLVLLLPAGGGIRATSATLRSAAYSTTTRWVIALALLLSLVAALAMTLTTRQDAATENRIDPAAAPLAPTNSEPRAPTGE